MINKTFGSGIRNENISNRELAKELYKPIIRKFKKRKVHSPFIDNIWGSGLVDMQLISKFDKEFRLLLCLFYIYSKYACVVPLKDKKGITITNAFQKILKESNWRKPNKTWVDKGSEFYNSSSKKQLKDNDTEMYSIHNEGKSVVAERFIRTLKTKIYKYMTSISKNVYIDKLDDIVNKYNNTYHSTIKMKPVDVKSNTYINSSKEINDKNPKFKVGDNVRISKYKNVFAKGYTTSWVEEVLVIKKKSKTLFPGHTVLMILTGNKLLERFTKMNCKKQVKQNLALKKSSREKVINYMLIGKVMTIRLIVR